MVSLMKFVRCLVHPFQCQFAQAYSTSRVYADSQRNETHKRQAKKIRTTLVVKVSIWEITFMTMCGYECSKLYTKR